LTATKEGRLAIIVAVAGTVLVVATAANIVGNNRADAAADDVREGLRTELARLPDDEEHAFPVDPGPIQAAVDQAMGRHPGGWVAVAAPDDRKTVVLVETGWTLWMRCIRVELRGDATVLTHVAAGPC
jgi:hypothetical protein